MKIWSWNKHRWVVWRYSWGSTGHEWGQEEAMKCDKATQWVTVMWEEIAQVEKVHTYDMYHWGTSRCQHSPLPMGFSSQMQWQRQGCSSQGTTCHKRVQTAIQSQLPWNICTNCLASHFTPTSSYYCPEKISCCPSQCILISPNSCQPRK